MAGDQTVIYIDQEKYLEPPLIVGFGLSKLNNSRENLFLYYKYSRWVQLVYGYV